MISGYDRAGTPEAPVGPRVRIYELAKDLGLQPKDLVAKVRAMAIDVANHMSQIEPADADRIRRAVDRERHESLVEERLTDTVIRRRSKSVPAPARPAAAAPPPPVPVAAPAPTPVAPPPVVKAPAPEPPEAREPMVAKAEPVVQAPAPAPPPPVEVKPAPPRVVESSRPIEVPVPPPGRPTDPSRALLKTIPQPVVTGSAATGAFIQLPGVPPRGSVDANAPRVEIKDRDEELRRLGRGGLLNRAPAGRDRFGRPSFGPGGQRPGSFPKKRVAAAGKKLKQTQITTPAEHKRVIRMGDNIAVADLAQKMGIKGKEVIKKL
ncbi:MAG TPA: translation initiation factor IF-2 N-terminal domain-containing protein, partial [Polyangia bacterium]